ncbi:MAG: alpha/beta fold hydrolase [Sphingomonas sp.]|jgi:thioesterase domain-containing protein|uniref:alpha/beta fold hydrolase n=1 Tax=Sphingomonas sp. TaxID=28214 RepID=UPI003566118F
MSTHPRITTLTQCQAELLGLLLDEMAGPAPQGPCLPERAEVRAAAGEITLVVIHGAGGHTLFLHQLARHLPRDQGLVGINADFGGDSAIPTPDDAEALIGRYVEAVRADRQLGAPLHLGGYSSGCLIALEVARRIEASGDSVASLTLIDPAPLPASQAFLHDELSIQELLARRFETARRAAITPISSIYPMVARVQEVIAAITAIVKDDPIAAPIHLLRATEGPEALPAAEVALWAARTAGGLFVSEVAADHAGIIAEPGIAAVGAAIVKWFSNPHSLEAV